MTFTLEDGVGVTGAVPMWGRIVNETLREAAPLVPPGSEVFEVGYGDGLLTCYLAKRYGWRISGVDMLPEAHEKANRNAQDAGVADLLDLRLVEADETWKLKGQYDAVFIKTVLYHAKTVEEYAHSLDWVASMLKPEGVFINFENGKANLVTYLYRKLRRRYYTDLCMYDGAIEDLYDERFDTVYRAHYGAISQFVAPIAPLYKLLARVEESLFKRTADNSYITALVARKKSSPAS